MEETPPLSPPGHSLLSDSDSGAAISESHEVAEVGTSPVISRTQNYQRTMNPRNILINNEEQSPTDVVSENDVLEPILTETTGNENTRPITIEVGADVDVVEVDEETSADRQINLVFNAPAEDVNTSAADFEEGPAAEVFNKEDAEKENDAGNKVKKKSKGKKRKAAESVEDDDEGSCCTICFEKWTNSGEHRIASMKCGHFFGYHCIEKWLRASSSCPNCNEKSTKKDLRVHYVARLSAIDTGEKDRALADLDKYVSKLYLC